MLKQITSILLIITLTTPTLSLAVNNDKLCFEQPAAKKLLLEIEYGQLSAQKLLVCQKSYSTSTTINKNNDILISGLTKDKVDLTKVSDEYKKKYIETNDRLNTIIEKQPSRFVWFGLGAGATVIVGILLAFMVRK
jgi:hypothetical protein